MSEAEIRHAIETAKNALPPTPSRTRRFRQVAATAAVGLGLAMLTACYGAPMPRPQPGPDATSGQSSNLQQMDLDKAALDASKS
ncbi:MAG: hypothetical protein KAI47_25335 [Deltaproteobacteria bacterium]|nr:hypothetical protein [Deltaproteobacteria bacterium]